MTLQLTLPRELEDRLRHEADRCGEPTESVALRLLSKHLPPVLDEKRNGAISMLERWAEEVVAGNVLGREHGNDAGDRQRGGDVELSQSSVGQGAGDDAGDQFTRQRGDVVEENGFAGLRIGIFEKFGGSLFFVF